MMQRIAKRVLAGVLLGKFIVWLGLSPRIARRLYARQLFKHELGKGKVSSLLEFNEVENREIVFENRDGLKLHGWLFKHPSSQKVLMYCIGRTADIAARVHHISLLLSTGASVFVFEYRGFGLSEGRPSIGGVCHDGVDAYEYLTNEEGFAAENVILLGESLGSGVATYISAHRKVGGIILQSPYESIEKVGKEQIALLKVYPTFMFPSIRLDNLAILRKPHAPLLILHGERDELIPIRHSERLFEQAAEPKRFVRGPKSQHTVLHPDDVELFVQTIREFLAELPDSPDGNWGA